MENTTYHIHLKGIVQGVGMRPAIQRFAMKWNLKGYVCNGTDGVHIEMNYQKKKGLLLFEEIVKILPPNTKVSDYRVEELAFHPYTQFEIKDSLKGASCELSLAPDYGLCPQCRKELQDPGSRRYRYPFTTCTQCGPRFSIQQSLPYDRSHTTMDHFTMCRPCETEYADTLDRRFYSQTNSCEDCGIHLTLTGPAGEEIARGNSSALDLSKDLLQKGFILAVKSIGGYLLLCDATHPDAIKRLRQKKQRPSKPFAVLCRNMDQVQTLVHCPKEAEALLYSPIAPVVVLAQKWDTDPLVPLDLIAPGLDTLGVMVPYAPIFEILMSQYPHPLIATSANQGSAPLEYQDEKALVRLASLADYILTHNREIISPQDDSVFALTPRTLTPIVLRRSRGMAPSLTGHRFRLPYTILSTGAHLKSTFTLSHQHNLYISQYLGNTENYDVTQRYLNIVGHFLNLLGAQVQLVLTDLHPGYFPTRFGIQWATTQGIPVHQVPHHKAHFAAVLGEHDLLGTHKRVLGIIWDGLGWGSDGKFWGGEFFVYKHGSMERVFHFEYFPVLMGDKMAREPRLSALSITRDLGAAGSLLEDHFTRQEWKVYRKMLNTAPDHQTDSCGRLFDGVASLLGICDKQSYEAEAAMRLENLARGYFSRHGYQMEEGYFLQNTYPAEIPLDELLKGIALDLKDKKSKDFIAAKFHYSLVKLIAILARQQQVAHIAFSGGVFHNSLLVDLLQVHLSNSHTLIFHQDLSPGDENISFGQLMYYIHDIDHIQGQQPAPLVFEKITANTQLNGEVV